MTIDTLIAAVRAHAVRHYNEDGWDYVVECWDDEEITKVIGFAESEKAAIAAVHKVVKTMGDYRDEIQSTAF